MESIFDRIWEKKVTFLAVFFVVFTLTYIFLVAIDFLPEPPEPQEQQQSTNETEIIDDVEIKNDEEIIYTQDKDKKDPVEISEDVLSLKNDKEEENTILSHQDFPVRLVIDNLSKDIVVLNPESRTIADLDTALLDGAVRHPDSATLGQEGNVFILGHSSYLPTVFNKNFKAFNGIQNLEWGDVIKLYSEDYVFEYRVENVYRAVSKDLTVPIAGTEKRLTLATCNSFGSVDDRFIVEAIQTGYSRL